ncbi:MAG TPA: hydantoinase/oxoprolinase family protein, partial [Alphaproteobacteria bacterium]|nr:hydantoinase/oxoprolinase family protein [Alphaproteobacteria bacterium]
FRLSAYGLVAKPSLPAIARSGTLASALSGERAVAFAGSFRTTPVYDRARLAGSVAIPGPAVVEDAGASTLVPPDFAATLDPFGNLVLERRRA